MTEYELVRSRRKTLSVQVTRECRVIVRAPLRLAKREIDRFVSEHADWIARALAHQRTLAEAHPEPDEAQARALAERAVREIPPKVRHYAAIMGLRPTGIRITSARTRFGSCSGKNSLCFSWRLMEYPEEAVDYVVRIILAVEPVNAVLSEEGQAGNSKGDGVRDAALAASVAARNDGGIAEGQVGGLTVGLEALHVQCRDPKRFEFFHQKLSFLMRRPSAE